MGVGQTSNENAMFHEKRMVKLHARQYLAAEQAGIKVSPFLLRGEGWGGEQTERLMAVKQLLHVFRLTPH